MKLKVDLDLEKKYTTTNRKHPEYEIDVPADVYNHIKAVLKQYWDVQNYINHRCIKSKKEEKK